MCNIRASFCNPYSLEITECAEGAAETKLLFVLLPQSILTTEFSDSARVKKIVGDLWFLPSLENPPTTSVGELVAAWAAVNTFQSFSGIRKRTINDAGQAMAVDPLNNDYDFSESKWLKTWQHLQIGGTESHQHSFTGNFNIPVAHCEVETTGLTDNTFTSGTGTINIETDCTNECITCPQDISPVGVAGQVVPRPYHLGVNWRSRRGFSLRENEELVLDSHYAFPNAPSTIGPFFKIVGAIKVQVEY